MVRKPVFVECERCGERWKVATTPMDARKFCAALRRGCHCPNCEQKGKGIRMCPNEGENSVTEARNGREWNTSPWPQREQA